MVGCCAGSQGELVKGRSEDEEDADCPASGKGHLREALLLHEEALRVNRLMTRIVIRQQQRSFDFCYCPDITTLPILMITYQDVPGAEEEGHPLGGVETQPRPVFEQVRRR